MSRSWFSNFQGAADWATGNRWDFDNMGGQSSVAAQHNNLSNDDGGDGGGYKPSWADAFKVADKWNQGQKGGYTPGSISKGPFNWPTPGATKVGNNSTIYNPTESWWTDYQVYNPPVDNSPSFASKALGIGGSLVGLVNPAAGVAMKAGAQFV